MKQTTKNRIIKYLKYLVKFLIAYISIKLVVLIMVFLFFYFHIDTIKFEQSLTDFTIIILAVIAVVVDEIVRKRILK